MDGEAIKRLLDEVADDLVGDEQRCIVVVGGSLFSWHGLREATRDIDSILRLDDEPRAAVRRVAERHDLAFDWLNDHADAFAPFGFDVEACEVLLDTPRLRVLGAPFRDVFLMKLRRSDPQDLIDIRALWPYVTWIDREHVCRVATVRFTPSVRWASARRSVGDLRHRD